MTARRAARNRKLRGRSGQGSDRTGRAHSLTTLLFDKVPTKFEVTLVRASLCGRRLRQWRFPFTAASVADESVPATSQVRGQPPRLAIQLALCSRPVRCPRHELGEATARQQVSQRLAGEWRPRARGRLQDHHPQRPSSDEPSVLVSRGSAPLDLGSPTWSPPLRWVENTEAAGTTALSKPRGTRPLG